VTARRRDMPLYFGAVALAWRWLHREDFDFE